MNADFEMGKTLYETYAQAVNDDRMPGWDGMTPTVQAAWAAVAVEARKLALPDEMRKAAAGNGQTSFTSVVSFSPGDTVVVQYSHVPSASTMSAIRKGLEEAGAGHVVFVPDVITGLAALHQQHT